MYWLCIVPSCVLVVYWLCIVPTCVLAEADWRREAERCGRQRRRHRQWAAGLPVSRRRRCCRCRGGRRGSLPRPLLQFEDLVRGWRRRGEVGGAARAAEVGGPRRRRSAQVLGARPASRQRRQARLRGAVAAHQQRAVRQTGQAERRVRQAGRRLGRLQRARLAGQRRRPGFGRRGRALSARRRPGGGRVRRRRWLQRRRWRVDCAGRAARRCRGPPRVGLGAGVPPGEIGRAVPLRLGLVLGLRLDRPGEAALHLLVRIAGHVGVRVVGYSRRRVLAGAGSSRRRVLGVGGAGDRRRRLGPRRPLVGGRGRRRRVEVGVVVDAGGWRLLLVSWRCPRAGLLLVRDVAVGRTGGAVAGRSVRLWPRTVSPRRAAPLWPRAGAGRPDGALPAPLPRPLLLSPERLQRRVVRLAP